MRDVPDAGQVIQTQPQKQEYNLQDHDQTNHDIRITHLEPRHTNTSEETPNNTE